MVAIFLFWWTKQIFFGYEGITMIIALVTTNHEPTELDATYKSRLIPKKLFKKTDASIGETGYFQNFFFNSHLGLSRSLRSNDDRCWNFEAGTSKFCNCSWKLLGAKLRKNCKILRSLSKNFNLDRHLTSTNSKGLCENWKKKWHGIIPFLS